MLGRICFNTAKVGEDTRAVSSGSISGDKQRSQGSNVSPLLSQQNHGGGGKTLSWLSSGEEKGRRRIICSVCVWAHSKPGVTQWSCVGSHKLLPRQADLGKHLPSKHNHSMLHQELQESWRICSIQTPCPTNRKRYLALGVMDSAGKGEAVIALTHLGFFPGL